jgi:ParB family chromosome partitioning protein
MNDTTRIDLATSVLVGEERDIPLDMLKASPRNARRVGHSQADIESRAASIQAKGLLQALVVEPERRADGEQTGYFLVTIGEGRRQALRLLAKRKVLAKTSLIRCRVDLLNDPYEISLDENVSRRDLHPADQFEAFKDLAERRGWGAEEIGARFGVSPQIVRQRLRLGAVAPALLDLYRTDALTLDQMMAFAVSPDHERQMQVFGQMGGDRPAYAIRRAMTEAKVPADDRRAIFIGLDVYVEAGGPVLRDLFTEDRGGWLEDVVLLDRLVAEKLAALATEVREAEGWKWASAHIDFPFDHGCARVWEKTVERTAEVQARIDALTEEGQALAEQWGQSENLPAEVETRLGEIETALATLGHAMAYAPDDIARAGVIVVLGHDGRPRIERGFVRPEDELVAATDEEEPGDGDNDDAETGRTDAEDAKEADDAPGDPAAPLPARLVADLTAHRSAALRDALAENPDLAQVALAHVLVLRTFGQGLPIASCLDIRTGSHDLNSEGEGIEDSRAGRAIAERHAAWARQVPNEPDAVWDFVVGLDGDSRASLLAHCVSLCLDAVHGWERRTGAWRHADRLATALDLDMTAYWSPTAGRYLGRVTKAHVLAAVSEGVSSEAAQRIEGLKKPQMVEAAEPLLVATPWLPALLRTPGRPGSTPTVPGGEGQDLIGEAADTDPPDQVAAMAAE